MAFITEDKDFAGVVFANGDLSGDYENCRFKNCVFTEIDLAGISFIECEFDGCNLSSAQVRGTAFKTVKFKNCKLLGLLFSDCNAFLFSVHFDNCLLNLASFFNLKMKATQFKNCSMHEVDFTQADLTGSAFTECDLAGAVFENTIIEKADLRSAHNYSINPQLNRIKKAKFSLHGVPGLLQQYNIDIE